MSAKYIWLVATDGYSAPNDPEHADLSLSELAELMLALGGAGALSLDGGSSDTLICGGRLINDPQAARMIIKNPPAATKFLSA